MRTMPPQGPIVLLVGASAWPQTLVLAHRLHREGLTCIIVDTGGAEYRAPFIHRWLTRSTDLSRVRDALFAWRDDPRLRLVVPMLEDMIPVCHAVFAGKGCLLNEHCPVSLDTLLSKSLMLQEARQAGLIVPHSEVIETAAQGLQIARAWGYPIMVKGDSGAAGVQVRRCDDPAALEQAFAQISKVSKVSVQEWVDGETWAAGGYFEAGRVLRVQVFQKLLLRGSMPMAPPEKIRHETLPQAMSDLERFGQHLRWNGYGQIDYMRRPSGELVFLEFNPRAWGSITAADAAGGDLLGALAQRARGEAVVQDLDNHDGWSGLVYPKPLPRLAREGRWLDVARLLLSRDFRGSRPGKAWSRNLDAIFIKWAYWSLRAARTRKPERHRA